MLTTIVLCTAAGCGSAKDPERASKMTPEKASQVMRRMAADVMAAAVPDEQTELPSTHTPIPCGGLEGNDFSKIKYGAILHSQKSLDDAGEAFRAVAAKLKGLGYEVDPAETMGTTTSMNFSGEAAGGSLTWHGSGPLSLNVETKCLENPDRGKPAAGAS
jgi:hypothetical protein